MTSNVLPLHFVLNVAKSSLQLLDLDKYYEHITSALWTLAGNQILSRENQILYITELAWVFADIINIPCPVKCKRFPNKKKQDCVRQI